MLSWMLGKQVGSSEPPPPPPLFEEPWRKIKWTERPAALQYVNNYTPFAEAQQLRILLHGAAGSGKSSFIDSVQSTLRGRMCVEALVDNHSEYCFTKQVRGLQNLQDPARTSRRLLPFRLQRRHGPQRRHIKLCLRGRVKDSYRFNPESKLCQGDRFHNEAPADNDKVHVLVCVIAANTPPSLSDAVKRKIRDIRLEASGLGIPQVAVLTKVDEACPEVQRDLRNVYRSRRLKKKMEQLSADSGIPMNCIFPVKNYHEEIDLSDDMDALILSVLTSIIHFGDDCINRAATNAAAQR
ncbi:interferon-induced protein 44-like [Betta splendens]|uniref:Interferon-induced protein 44-like n=1 Tax=Betta splendens TaxID=158456 RepID=A0A9W2XLU2_BETSP|nr:interferon-induced protein 44-like [Betta splendens]